MPQPYLPGVTSPCMQPHPQPAPFPSNGNDRLVYPGPPGPALPLLAEFSHHVIFILITSKIDDISSPFENLPSARPFHPPHSTSTRATLQPAPHRPPHIAAARRHTSMPDKPSSLPPIIRHLHPKHPPTPPAIRHSRPKPHPSRQSTTHPSDLTVHHPHPPSISFSIQPVPRHSPHIAATRPYPGRSSSHPPVIHHSWPERQPTPAVIRHPSPKRQLSLPETPSAPPINNTTVRPCRSSSHPPQPAPSFNLPRTARRSPPLAHTPTDHPLAHPSSTIPGRNISHPWPKHQLFRHSTTHPSDLAVHHPHPPYAPPTDTPHMKKPSSSIDDDGKPHPTGWNRSHAARSRPQQHRTTNSPYRLPAAANGQNGCYARTKRILNS